MTRIHSFIKFHYSALLLTMMAITLTSSAFADLKQIGLEGKEVTALFTVRRGKDTLLIAGTKSDGVFCQRGSTGQFILLDQLGAVKPSPLCMGIRCFFVRDSSALYAGSDSGLVQYMLISMIEPMWIRVRDIPAGPVTDIIGTGDTLFCCTPAEVYRSTDKGSTWSACSTRTFLPPLGNITSFTSLAFFAGVNAGSTFSGALNSWQGILHSPDLGKTWEDVSQLPPQTRPAGQVYDLIAYRKQYLDQSRLLAATDNGLMFVEGDLDTGYWHPLETALNGATATALHVSYETRSLLASLFASSDSGAYVLWYGDKTWTRLTDMATNAITASQPVDANQWFLGTSDGVWRYTKSSVGIVPHVQPQVTATHRSPSYRYFTCNGRRVHAARNDLPAGVFLVLDKGKQPAMPRKTAVVR